MNLMQPRVHLYNEYAEILKELVTEVLSFFDHKFIVFCSYFKVIK